MAEYLINFSILDIFFEKLVDKLAKILILIRLIIQRG